jgi:hypothetical protein
MFNSRAGVSSSKGRSRQRVLGLAAVLVVAASGLVATPAAAAVPGLLYITAETGFDSSVYKSVRAICPGARQAVGGGYVLAGAEGSVVLDDFIPSTNSFLVGAGEIVDPGGSSGTSESWQIRATVVCANPLPGYTIVSNTSDFTRGAPRPIDATCPAGTVAIGGGASLSNGWGQISIVNMEVLTDVVIAAGIEDQDGYSGNWSITAYAICANSLPGLHPERIFSNPYDSNRFHSATAFCPAGQQAIGSGWEVTSGSPLSTRELLNIHLTIFGGEGLSSGVGAFGSEDANGFNRNWEVWAEAICADA